MKNGPLLAKMKKTLNMEVTYLSIDYLASLIKQSYQDIGDSWTTSRSKQRNAQHYETRSCFSWLRDKKGKNIKQLADNIYDVFQSKHDF